MDTENPTTAEEAFRIEVLREARSLLKQLKEIDKTLEGKIKKSIEEGTGRAYTAARLRYEELISQSENKLVQAGHKAAALIGNQLDSKIAEIVGANNALERKGWKFVIIVAIAALIAGAVGGVIGSLPH